MTKTAKCLCESVTVTADLPEGYHACHCGICRKWAGSPLLALHASNVVLEGAENITIYGSSDWAERGFCKFCGTNIFYRLKDESAYFLPAGLMEAEDELTFESQIYIDKKPAGYDFSNETPRLTEAETLALFTGENS